MLITHKLVLVTGASGGIGAAIAKEMAKAGGRIILLARRQEALDQVAKEIRASGREAWPFSVD
jgi:NADP-dependent 3-hydroxy acid dehydrogenase YdfG